ncbi:MAG: acyl-CoA desaturase [Cyclobacteriaceae bacterium]
MIQQPVQFNVDDRPEFFKELRKRVNHHFKENNKSRNANASMVIKTIFMITLYFTPWILMLTEVVTGVWPTIGMWTLMGFGMAGIGLSIMHDANHGSYSKNKTVNWALGYLVNFLGAYHSNWKIQHNVLHHSFTNVDGHDEDIAKDGVMRFSPTQERKPFFKYQIFYAPFLYGIMTIYWFMAKDFQQAIRYHKKDLLKTQGLTKTTAILELIFNKAWYLGGFLALPIIMISTVAWWQTVLGFLLMHFICGLILAFIFQPAHVINETSFYVPDENNSVENNWAIHQLHTTANFANGSRWFSWLIGGLNFQIEHHLFPNICHVHYRDISKIVKATAEEFDVPYYRHGSFFDALRSHFSLLHSLGTGAYDKKEKTENKQQLVAA